MCRSTACASPPPAIQALHRGAWFHDSCWVQLAKRRPLPPLFPVAETNTTRRPVPLRRC
jgi:hypothetical protein